MSILPTWLTAQTDSTKTAIKFKIMEVGDGFVINAKNNSIIPLHYEVLDDEKNDSLILRGIIPVDTSVNLLHYDSSWTKDSLAVYINKKYSFYYSYTDPENIQPDTNYRYRLPFRAGKKFRIMQGFGGKFSHRNYWSRYAIDFTMKVGEPVYAAREGLVVYTVDHFTEAGGEEMRRKANKINILHADGTLANYVHLDYKGVLVQEGDSVSKGQQIGIAGFTGFTTAPHLHFVVWKGRSRAIPIYFEGYEDKELKQRKKYKIK